jgi:indole-3-glycerol phosphate synthase
LTEKLVEDSKRTDHAIYKFMNGISDGDAPMDRGRHFKRLYDTIMGSKLIAVLPEYNKKSKTGFITSMPPPEIMGGVLREADAKGIIVSLNLRTGGTTPEEFSRFVAEQLKARIFLPGPISIIWNDVIVDEIQVLHAASLGADAIMLQERFCSDWEHFSSLVRKCNDLNMEPIVMISTEEEGMSAIKAGARALCLHALDEEGLLRVRATLPSHTTEPSRGTNVGLQLPEEGRTRILYAARLPSESDFSIYSEIDTAWVLRDSGGFNAVWPSPEAVYGVGMGDIYSAVGAMRSHASRQYLSPRQFMMNRRNEGATEYLGDILY